MPLAKPALPQPDIEIRNEVPERALLAAMLDEAITTIKLREFHLARNARAWILSRDKEPFSFEWVCQELDLCPKIVRREIAKRVMVAPHE